MGIPTETVYGLAAHALDADAVVRIFEAKERPSFNPLIVHVHDSSQFEKYAVQVPDRIYNLAEKFSPGPITFILPRKSLIPDIVVSGGDTVALRIPNHPLTLELLSVSGMPLAAPSANPFGYISPVTAAHVKEQLEGKLPYVLDGGTCSVGLESTVVSFFQDELIVHRLGGITLEDLKKVEPRLRTDLNLSSNPISPGQLKSHYAPRIPMILGDIPTLMKLHESKRCAVLSFQQSYSTPNLVSSEVLSSSGDLHEAARNLFAAMRRLDATASDLILAEEAPNNGIGMAINDRLKRAASAGNE